MKTHRFLKGRVMAILLVLCMAATLLPVTAFAADTLITSVEIMNMNFGKPSEGIEIGSPAYDVGTFNNISAGAWTVTNVSWETTDANGKIQEYSDGNVHLNITLTANAGYKFGTETTFGYYAWTGNATVNGEAATCSYFDDGKGGAQELVVSVILPAKQTEQSNNCMVRLIVHSANGATGTVQYRDVNSDSWVQAALTPQSGSTDTYTAEITSVPFGYFSIKATPDTGYGMDTGRGVSMIDSNGGSWTYGTDDIASDTGMKFDFGSPYIDTFEFGFDNAGTPGGGQPAQDNTFEIVLDNVNEGGTLPAELGSVNYALDSLNATGSSNFVSLDTDHDGTGTDVTLTKGNTGGEQSKVKYTYSVSETYSYQTFTLLIAPAEGKTVKVVSDNAGQITEVKAAAYPDVLMLEVPAGAFYRIEFSDAGSQPGGDTDGTDIAPAGDAAKLQFYDRQNNNITYDEFKRANLGTVQYSTDDGVTWNEFTSPQVTSDANLLWYTDKSDQDPANWKQIYYFNSSDANSVKLKVSSGALLYTLKDNFGKTTSDNLRNDEVMEDLLGSGYELKIVPQYDGIRNITWSDDAQEASQRVENGKVIIEKAVIGEENALITDGQYSQQGNKGYVGVTGGSITGGEKVIDSGNLRLSVIDSNMTAEQKVQMQNSAAAKDTDILTYLEVDLERFVNKGNSGDEWIEDLEELSEKIKITLNVGTDLDANKTYVVVREHNGVYEQIPATYDKVDGTLTFESDRFSDYALATVSEDTPVHTHTYGDWKSDGTNHWKECSCGDKTGVADHDFKWVVDKEASAAATGSKHE